MKKLPLISICIAVYNHEKYIKECLDSIVHFEWNENIEIIIINDASTDNTHQIIKQWIKDHWTISIHYENNEKNLWQVKALSKAVNLANGEYITFMDSDDFLIKSSLWEKIKKFLTNPDLKIIYANGVFFRKNIMSKKGFHNYLKKIFNKDIYHINKYFRSHTPLLSISWALLKKDFFLSIGGFDSTWYSNDWITNIKVFSTLQSKEEYLMDYDPVFAYRIHNNNISKNPNLQYNLLMHVINNYSYDEQAKNNLIKQALFVTSIRYKMINNTTEAKFYLKNLKQHFWLSIQYFIGWIIIKLPYKLLVYTENITRNVKQYFKGKLF